jgi:hypothetical protein
MSQKKHNMKMKVDKTNIQLLHSAVTHFIGEPVVDLSRFDESVVFITGSGTTGFMEPNFEGNWDIWIGDEVVYEMERELFDILDFTRTDDGGLIEFYNYIKDFDPNSMKYKSRTFFEIIRSSVENIILNHDIPITGNCVIGSVFVHYGKDKKFKINLN